MGSRGRYTTSRGRRSGSAARIRRVRLPLVAVTGVLLLVSCAAWFTARDSTPGRNDAPVAEPPPTAPEEPAVMEPDEPTAPSEPEPEPEPDPGPESGPGTFRVASGGGEPVGRGTVFRYQVQVEDGIALDPDDTAAEVHAVLGHERGWTRDGRTGFRLVGGDEAADFLVRIATPATVDAICGEYGLDTGGEVNCRVGESVMVNLRRWQTGSPQFPGPVEEYRALIINHEVGHFLGHGHEGCPAPGAPAPAMMQQIKGLDGCVANAWPYDENGDYLAGPAVP
ncbi:DUF3152 domain-containing protein [Streptomyces johnsoniae]|uniref:DUF3152 domain-containing protein n=1 Tax=Streptomyces johnsoniae TaxID=3075532 RepID=A0ABU2S0J2_9ACTN|nr:DUF3152 domain-containing protein [Streptomyces sp. DSM 41886]MDT0442201.1 DUF3152 domain-containing protein [Streptomyces sp. DSM 41886]